MLGAPEKMKTSGGGLQIPANQKAAGVPPKKSLLEGGGGYYAKLDNLPDYEKELDKFYNDAIDKCVNNKRV